MKKIFHIVFSFMPFCGLSQDCSLKLQGEVRDFHDGTPIIGASIDIAPLGINVTTDKDGMFTISKLCKNTAYTTTISHVDSDTKSFELNLSKDTYKTFKLERHLEELEEVALQTLIAKKQTNTGQETLLNQKVIDNYSSLSLGDALKEVPGVTSINTGNAIVKPIINGMHSSRVLILNNGVRLQDQEWGIEHAPNIDINSAGQISIIKGSSALAFGGDAIGGVIVVQPSRAILKDSLYGKTMLGLHTNGRGYFTNSSLSKNYASGWFAQLQGSYKKNGDFETPNYSLTNTGAESIGLTARFGKKTFTSGFEVFYSFIDNEIGILRAAHIGNIRNLATSINASRPVIIKDFSYDINPPKQEITHHLFKASYYKRFENFGKVDIQYDYQNNQRFEFDLRRGGRSSIPAIDLNLQTHTISTNLKMDKNLDQKLRFGLMGRYQDNFANPDTGVRRLIPDYDKFDLGAYFTSEWIVNDKVFMDAGLRYDFSRIDALKFYRTSDWGDRGYNNGFTEIIIGSVIGGEIVDNVIDPNASQYLTNPVFDYHNISASFGLKYEFNDTHWGAFGYNLSSRAPNPSELFSDGLHHSAARIEIGDLRIDSERSHRFGITYGYNADKINFQVETYLNHVNDFIYLVPGPDGIIPLIRGPFPVWEFIQTDALFFGVDVNVDYQFSDALAATHKSSFIKGYDSKADLPLIDVPPFITTNGIMYTNPKWYDFRASLNSEWVFEQNEFPEAFNYSVAIANEDDIEVDIGPPPAYHLVHLQSEITFSAFKKTSLNIKLSIDNLFNTSYRKYLNRLRFFADDLGRNVRLQLQLNY